MLAKEFLDVANKCFLCFDEKTRREIRLVLHRYTAKGRRHGWWGQNIVPSGSAFQGERWGGCQRWKEAWWQCQWWWTYGIFSPFSFDLTCLIILPLPPPHSTHTISLFFFMLSLEVNWWPHLLFFGPFHCPKVLVLTHLVPISFYCNWSVWGNNWKYLDDSF